MDRKSWIKDIISPTNLWSVAQWASPAGSATVSGWLSYLLHFPPSVILMVAMMTAASTLVLVSEIRKNSIYQTLYLERITGNAWSFSSSSMTGVLHLQADFISTHPHEIIFYRVEVLSLVLEGLANRSENYIGADVMHVAPNGRFGYLLGEIGPLKLGQVDGYLHGKSEKNLKHELEMRVLLSGVAYIDAQQGPRLTMKWMKEETKTK
jgi:hypothetical protein